MATKKKTTKRSKRNFRTELKRIVRFLNKGDRESYCLWHVLSALRGPDDGDDYIKRATTAVIRQAIGMKNDTVPALVREDSSTSKTKRVEMDDGSYNHFKCHAISAFRALGLDWDRVNPE